MERWIGASALRQAATLAAAVMAILLMGGIGPRAANPARPGALPRRPGRRRTRPARCPSGDSRTLEPPPAGPRGNWLLGVCDHGPNCGHL